jgi:type IV secretory pathway VirB2 component (pilin)
MIESFEMQTIEYKSNAGTAKYILAWILASISGSIATRIIDEWMFTGVQTMDELARAYYLAVPVELAAIAVIFIATYSIFSSLNVRRVIPWLWGLGGLGTAASVWMLIEASSELPKLMYVYPIVCFVAMVLLIRQYFVMAGRY